MIKFLNNFKNLVSAKIDEPDFRKIQPDLAALRELAVRFSFVRKIILVGNGGSVNTFRGIYQALADRHSPELVIIDTNEPEVLARAKHDIDPKTTLLLSISKSGGNVSQIESTLYFADLPHKIFITGEHGVLRDMAGRDSSIVVLKHPEMSGRFSGLTEVGLLPAYLCGFDVEAMALRLRDAKSNAWSDQAEQAAQILWQLEQQGITEIAISVYGRRLEGFNLLIQQLLHETWAKNGLGQTVIPLSSPESQHHTLQRLLAGRKTLATFFVVVSGERSESWSVPEKFQNITLANKKLSDLSNSDGNHSFTIEYKSTKAALDELQIPNMTLELESVNAATVADYISFWQLVAYYGAKLRGLEPYTQPEVEEAKKNSLNMRLT